MDFFSVPRGDCRFLEQNDTRLKGYVEIGVDAEACVFLPDPGDGGYRDLKVHFQFHCAINECPLVYPSNLKMGWKKHEGICYSKRLFAFS